jgi:hypothetical protein
MSEANSFQNRTDKLEKLRALISEGEASGEPVPFDIKEFHR